MKRKTFDHMLAWHEARRNTRAFNRLTGLSWTPRQLRQAGEDYVTREMQRMARRAWNRERMGILETV